MSRRRLIPLVVLVTALLAIVALAARGRPLGTSGSTSGGLPTTFWDFVFTSVLILMLLMAFAAFGALVFLRRERSEVEAFPRRTAATLAILITVAALFAFFGFHIDLNHLLHPNTSTTTTPTGAIPQVPQRKPGAHHVQFRWEELVAVFGALLALGAVVAMRSRLRPKRHPRWVAPAALAAALDESLDDLRNDPDVRRAIIAAYARMESALAAAGFPRRPSEAPLEYLERVLLALDTSAAAVRRLTDLFEWARFSQHEPEAAMRDEAVDALVAVRDELRAMEPAAA